MHSRILYVEKSQTQRVKRYLNTDGVPGRIRTADLPLRRGLRYPSVPPGREIKDTLNNKELQKYLTMMIKKLNGG